MKKIILNAVIIVLGIFLYLQIFRYLYSRLNLAPLIHKILEPEKDVYIGLNYLEIYYFSYSLLWLFAGILAIKYFKNGIYFPSIYILFIINIIFMIYVLSMN